MDHANTGYPTVTTKIKTNMRDPRFSAADCPMTRAMSAMGSKWKPIIINAMGMRTLRFGQLDAIVPLITRKVLTEQLKEMEEDGIILRQSYIGVPSKVEYSLTEKGIALLPILKGIIEWNEKYAMKDMEGDNG